MVKTLYSGTNDTKHINCHYCFSFDLHYFPITSVNVIYVIQNILHELIVISVPYMSYKLVLINLTCGLHPTSYIIFYLFPYFKDRVLCSVCRNHYPVLSLFMTYNRVCNKSNTKDVTCRARTADPSGAPEFTPDF